MASLPSLELATKDARYQAPLSASARTSFKVRDQPEADQAVQSARTQSKDPALVGQLQAPQPFGTGNKINVHGKIFPSQKDMAMADVSSRGARIPTRQHTFEKVLFSQQQRVQPKEPAPMRPKPAIGPRSLIPRAPRRPYLAITKQTSRPGPRRKLSSDSGTKDPKPPIRTQPTPQFATKLPSPNPVALQREVKAVPVETRPRVLTGSEAREECPELLTDYEFNEIKDYKEIYFLGTQASKLTRFSEDTFDDQRGDYQFCKGEHLAYRYEVLNLLGKGSFGQVLRCTDHKTRALVAVKLVRNKPKFHKQAQTEIQLLNLVREADKAQASNIIHVLESCVFRKHVCIMFPMYSINLYELIKTNRYSGLSLRTVRYIGQQLFVALAFLADQGILHCDIKPENILLEYAPGSSITQEQMDHGSVAKLCDGRLVNAKIKLIDLGSSCQVGKQIYTYIQSRFYRSPEVILGAPYGTPIDVWSAGLVLAELFIGYPLFPGENEGDQLNCIMQVTNLPSAEFLQTCRRTPNFFSGPTPRPHTNSRSTTRAPGSKSLSKALRCSDALFTHLISRTLDIDPATRISASQALLDPFFS